MIVLQGSAIGLVLLVTVTLSQADVPNDNLPIWPSPAHLDTLSKSINGTIFFPKSLNYLLQASVMNTRFYSRFGIIVMAESTADVQQAILFCKQYGIRPTVKSGGHDYIGRASGDNTVSINLSRMKKILVQNDTRSATGVSAIVEPGNTNEAVYKRLHEEGYLMVGGSAHTVAEGGYTLGGGHSPMSRMFGLAVDNVIEFTMVTPDGSIITLTKDGGSIQQAGSSVVEAYNDPELFWAVRGGGGGTFGVVTSFTFQLHLPPEDGFCYFIALYPMDLAGNRVGKDVIKTFSPYLLHNMTDNWGGYVVFSAETSETAVMNISIPQDPTVRGLLIFSLLHVGSCETAKPQLDFLFEMHKEDAFHMEKIEYDTFWDYEKGIDDAVGFRTYIINRFLQPADMENPGKMATVLSEMIDAKKPVGGTWTLLGCKVSSIPTSSSSVSDNFRTALGSLSVGVGWGTADEDKAYIEAMQEYGEKLYTIGDGVYFNEPDEFLVDWQEEYWGNDTYSRLLAVKQRIDEDDMFWCLHCVGSDLRDPEPYSSSTDLLAPVRHGVLAVVLSCLYVLM